MCKPIFLQYSIFVFPNQIFAQGNLIAYAIHVSPRDTNVPTTPSSPMLLPRPKCHPHHCITLSNSTKVKKISYRSRDIPETASLSESKLRSHLQQQISSVLPSEASCHEKKRYALHFVLPQAYLSTIALFVSATFSLLPSLVVMSTTLHFTTCQLF